jgi:hypothetical protein
MGGWLSGNHPFIHPSNHPVWLAPEGAPGEEGAAMPQPFPNHLVSIPQSIVSFRHYFRVHDQAFGRTALYGLILAALVTALSTGMSLVGSLREAPKLEARLATGLEKAMAGVSFKDGKASSTAKQPAILWQDFEPVPPGAEGAKRPAFRILLAVLDTTGAVATWEKAAEFAGCPELRRVVLLGQQGIASVELAKAQQEGGGQESWPYTDQARLAEVKKLIEEKGGKFPEFTLENGLAKFKLDPPKVHILVHTSDLLALADATGKGLQLGAACQQAVEERPEIQPPLFLVLVTATGAALKPIYEKAPLTLEFEGRSDLAPATLARWIAGAARRSYHGYRVQATLHGLFPGLMGTCFTLLVTALISSVGGLAASALLRAGFPYGQLFTMAVYAMTPAWLVLLILAAAGLVGGQWGLIVPIVIGLGYTATAAYRTARELGGTAVAPAPKL